MLVLTRKLKEQIRVGNEITITILRVSGKSVRVGIEAPREVRVVRAELPSLEGERQEGEEMSVEIVQTNVARASGRRGPKTTVETNASAPRAASTVVRINPREAVDAMTQRVGDDRRGPLTDRVTMVESSVSPSMRPSEHLGPLAVRGLVGRRR